MHKLQVASQFLQVVCCAKLAHGQGSCSCIWPNWRADEKRPRHTSPRHAVRLSVCVSDVCLSVCESVNKQALAWHRSQHWLQTGLLLLTDLDHTECNDRTAEFVPSQAHMMEYSTRQRFANSTAVVQLLCLTA